MPNPPTDHKLYEVVEGRVIRLGEPDGLVTFTAKSRIWLTPAEAALHGDSIVLIYPPEPEPSDNA